MPLEAPDLDILNFEQIYERLRLRVPRYSKEWTDFNESDPGATMLQLFAWLSEMMYFQMNRIPERNYIKFLKLLNMELKPAQPALAHLTFIPQVGATIEPVLPRSQISAQPPDGGEPLIFETEAGVDLIKVLLTDIQVFNGQTFFVLSEANNTQGTTFRPLGWTPQVGAALYLGFTPPDVETNARLFPEVMRFRNFLAKEALAGQAQSCVEVINPPTPPVTLIWEYKNSTESPRWQRLNLFQDETAAFTREGYLQIEGPADIVKTNEGKLVGQDDEENEALKRYWIRCRIEAGSYPSHQIPEIDFIRPNVAPAKNLSTVQQEVLGESEGVPDQIFTLRRTPIVPDSLDLAVEDENGDLQPWQRVDDFLASKPDDSHYRLNPTKGEIRFGDGENGRIPVAGTEIVAREYRYGGGERGNVAAGLINAPMTALAGVETVINERQAEGGGDEQKLEKLKEQAPEVMRSRNRAVTAQDFAALADRAGGVAKATALSLAHPDHPGVEVPGAVTVVIVPESKDKPPEPSSELIRQVCRHLENFRLLTTEVYVKGPVYKEIKVEARVTAAPYAAFGQVSKDVIKKLNDYLDPLKWDFGRDLPPANFYNVILDVPEARSVPSLHIFVDGIPYESSTFRDPIILGDDNLVYGGDHEIVVEPHKDF